MYGEGTQLLTKEQEYALTLKISEGCRESYDDLVKKNIRLVRKVAAKYVYCGIEYDDLIQEGILGLVKAAEKFDRESGHKFSTYAVWWIRQTIVRAIPNSYFVRLPVHVYDKQVAYKRYILEHIKKYGRQPSFKEIAEQCGDKVERVEMILKEQRYISLDSKFESDQEMHNVIADESIESQEKVLSNMEKKNIVKKLFSCLEDRERKIIEMRYGINHPREYKLHEIGKFFNVTRERIRQVQVKAEKKMKTYARIRKIKLN